MIKIYQLQEFPPGNPFHHDQFNMGTQLGKNVTVMHGNFPDGQADYLIIVNTDTGERTRVALSEKGVGQSIGERIVQVAR